MNNMQAFQLFLNVIPFIVGIGLILGGIELYKNTPPKFRIVRATKTNLIHVQVSKFGLVWAFVQEQDESKSFFAAETNAYTWCDNERNRWHAAKAKKQQKYTVLRELDAAHHFTEDSSGYEAR